jgi:hypothetical protein
MGRPLGINAVMAAAIETTYGTTPATGFFKLPLVTHNLGEEQPLIEDDQLGFGREGLDPTYDVITNDGDLVVPVETSGFGFWLRMLLGAPTTTAGSGEDLYVHTFTSGSADIDSASVEIGNPDMPNYSTNYGAALNTMKIGMSRSGNLNATLSMIAQGETDGDDDSAAGTPTALRGPRFAQAIGSISIDGDVVGSVVSADFSFSNQLDKVEVIRDDGRIGGVDPGKYMGSGTLTTLFQDRTFLAKAQSKTPVALSFGWAINADTSLIFSLPRVFLPKPKRPITGPKGIQAAFNWQSSGASGHQLTAVLKNAIATY